MLHGGIIPVPSGGSGPGGGIPEAPMDNKTYGRKNSSWTEIDPTGVLTYTHTQSSAEATWNIQHNLGVKDVSARIVESGGEQTMGEIDWAASTVNLLVVRFGAPLAGTAFVRT